MSTRENRNVSSATLTTTSIARRMRRRRDEWADRSDIKEERRDCTTDP
jgi:hypothetical protein